MTSLETVKESLWSIEDDLEALLNSVDLCETDEQQRQIQSELAETLERAVAKRDQVSAWIGQQESTIAAIDAEIERLERLRHLRKVAAERVEDYITLIILSKGPNAKGKLPKLEGVTSRFSVRKNPPAVEITAESMLPEDYIAVELSFTGKEWRELADAIPYELLIEMARHTTGRKPMKQIIKRDLDAGKAISGAQLAPSKYRLVRE